MRFFAEIILPLAFKEGTFTFEITDPVIRRDIMVGSLVEVILGRNSLYTGVVAELHERVPDYKTIKSVQSIVNPDIVVNTLQLKFWAWISEYYMCTPGEVMKAALPSGLRDGIRPKTIIIYTLSMPLMEAWELTVRSKRQQQVLAMFESAKTVSRSEIIRSVTGAETALGVLVKRDILSRSEVEQTKLPAILPNINTLPELSQNQSTALVEIRQAMSDYDTVLLHGITGSGKTELYCHLIAEHLSAGHDVLYLVPEIVLTKQLVDRLERVFGDNVSVYHSMSSAARRSETFAHANASERRARLVLGARSALFLPTKALGLIVVDEEHEPSYKQNDPAPRYHARDAALMLAKLAGAKVVLGSATPSIESFHNAITGRYKLVRLTERYGAGELPTIIVSDTQTAYQRGDRTAQFNRILLDKIRQTVESGRQVLLFQNRRGYAPYIECGKCGTIPTCPSCNVTLTMHKNTGVLKCHYCGHSESVPTKCPKCGSSLKTKGFGTERIEQEIMALMPDVRIARMDSDNITTVAQYSRVINDIENGAVDIIIGTQMITKGLDFKGVALVGILNADNLLFYPDFRSAERAFQMLSQVSGRAGRQDSMGEVVIQSSQVDNPTLLQAASGDYIGMYNDQIAERESFLYPPFCRLIKLTFKHRDRSRLFQIEQVASERLERIFGMRLLGPESPVIDRVREEYISVFILKIERSKSFKSAKEHLRKALSWIEGQDIYKGASITVDVDPQQ